MESNKRIIMFVVAMCMVVALVLAGMYTVLKPIAKVNEEIFNKRAILKAVESKLGDKKVGDFSDEEILDLFAKQVEQVVIRKDGSVMSDMKAEEVDMAQERKKPEEERNLPLFIFNNGAEKNYIVNVRGNGLWDEIWGYIALESDLNTIAGASFDHTGETPGLGAEIKDNPSWAAQFIGDQIYNADGDYVSVAVVKGGASPDDKHGVDGISGATITADGVDEMMERGIRYYTAYLETLK